MKTYWAKPKQIERKWFLVDAKGQTLGRLSTIVADLLRGKNKPGFTPSIDCGDYVVIINTKLIKVTGNKLAAKKYYSHSGYPGGIKEKTLDEAMTQDPNKVVYRAILGMLPKNKLSNQVIKKLKLYQGSDYQNAAQKPEILELS